MRFQNLSCLRNQELVDVNVLLLVATKAFMPLLRQRKGRIIVLKATDCSEIRIS